MVEHKCTRCNQTFRQKGHLTYHLNRKRPCVAVNAADGNAKSPAKSGDLTANSGDRQLNFGETTVKSGGTVAQAIIDPNQCSYCRFTFKRSDYLRDHLQRGRCKLQQEMAKNIQDREELFSLLVEEREQQKKAREEDKQRIEHLTQLVLQQQKQLTAILQSKIGAKMITKGTGNTVNNGTVNNGTVNNITVQFGRETTDGLTQKEKMHILQAGTRSLLECIKAVHFEPNRPEYHNVYVSNLRSNIGMIFKENRFMVETIETIVEDLVDNRLYDVEQLLEELADALPQPKVKRVQAMVQRMKNEEESKTSAAFIKDLKGEIVRLCYNYRDIVHKTHALALANTKIDEK